GNPSHGLQRERLRSLTPIKGGVAVAFEWNPSKKHALSRTSKFAPRLVSGIRNYEMRAYHSKIRVRHFLSIRFLADSSYNHCIGYSIMNSVSSIRRLCLRMFGAIGLSLALASPVVYTPPAFADNPSPSNAAGDTSIRPFHAHFSDAQLADLRARIAATRWPDKETVGDRWR
ncbi:MAG: Microsomal epoxide hydrolase, partial [Caballeronia sp.]|nr:Microsomal epoxide hydrolase [Caballeronia sp.]